MMMFPVLLVSCSAGRGTVDYLPKPTTQALGGDYQRLQGTWIVNYNELKGVTTPQLYGAQHIFQGDRFRLGDDPPGQPEHFIIDETSRPKRIDFDDEHSPRVLGIYELDGERLTICTGAPGEARPKEFRTSIFSGAILTRLKRQ